MPGLAVEGAGVETGAAKVDLAVNFQETFDGTGGAAGIRGAVEFALDLFDTETRGGVRRPPRTRSARRLGPALAPPQPGRRPLPDERHEILHAGTTPPATSRRPPSPSSSRRRSSGHRGPSPSSTARTP